MNSGRNAIIFDSTNRLQASKLISMNPNKNKYK